MVMVLLGWVLFRAVDLPSAWAYMKAMLGFAPGGFTDGTATMYISQFGITILAGVICATPLLKLLAEKLKAKAAWVDNTIYLSGHLVQTLLFFVSVSFIVMNAHNPFIYFNF